jgi:molybdate transport system substrate-binding protein
MALNVLSAGAAKAVVAKVAKDAGVELTAAFGAVGAMKDKLTAGEPCDVIVLTRSMLEDLAKGKAIEEDSLGDLGRVRTGVAVKRGSHPPIISKAVSLSAALVGADAIYVPDLGKSTAGKHVASMLDSLGIAAEVEGRIREFPNGAAAMKAMAESAEPFPIGCTQVSEILYTEGVTLAGVLPDEFELATGYSAAVCSRAADPAEARRFVALLTGHSTQQLRAKAGFEIEGF